MIELHPQLWNSPSPTIEASSEYSSAAEVAENLCEDLEAKIEWDISLMCLMEMPIKWFNNGSFILT